MFIRNVIDDLLPEYENVDVHDIREITYLTRCYEEDAANSSLTCRV